MRPDENTVVDVATIPPTAPTVPPAGSTAPGWRTRPGDRERAPLAANPVQSGDAPALPGSGDQGAGQPADQPIPTGDAGGGTVRGLEPNRSVLPTPSRAPGRQPPGALLRLTPMGGNPYPHPRTTKRIHDHHTNHEDRHQAFSGHQRRDVQPPHPPQARGPRVPGDQQFARSLRARPDALLERAHQQPRGRPPTDVDSPGQGAKTPRPR